MLSLGGRRVVAAREGEMVVAAAVAVLGAENGSRPGVATS